MHPPSEFASAGFGSQREYLSKSVVISVESVNEKYGTPSDPYSVGWTECRKMNLFSRKEPFMTELGEKLPGVDVEYETYGDLSPEKDNVILVEHALSGDAHAAGWDKNWKRDDRPWRAGKPGWWDGIIGPGKALDTNRYFVICQNVLGSCYGSTGPGSPDPETGSPYGLSFPMVTVGDWVRLQARVLDELGIERLHAVVGGSLGGQQAIEWALAFPDRVRKAAVLAAAPCLSAQGLAFNAVGRYSILNDPSFKGGNYYGRDIPASGLAAARMLAHITYLSDEGMEIKFGRKLKQKTGRTAFSAKYEVESYLNHQGRSFVDRFDANSYLYISSAMDHYDASRWGGGDLVEACGRIASDVLVVSFNTDWLYPSRACRNFSRALTLRGKSIAYADLSSPCGHDAFLVEKDSLTRLLKPFIEKGGERA